jgi:serine/threonine protein kinase
VHRDLKPQNVLLAEGSLEKPKIADFGLALVAGGTRLTQTNAFVGTPCYLAPEIIRGEKATEASDVYAIGAILYESLVGRPPFIGASLAAILDRAVKDAPTSPRRLKPQIPAPLERICLQCLEKAPQHRLPSAGAIASSLERFLGERRQRNAGEAAREGLALAWVSFLRAASFLLGLVLGIAVGIEVGVFLASREWPR